MLRKQFSATLVPKPLNLSETIRIQKRTAHHSLRCWEAQQQHLHIQSQRGSSHQGKGEDSHQTLRQQNCCNELSLLKGVTINKPKSGNCNSLWGKEAEGWSWELQTGKAHFSSRRMVEIPINNRIIKHIKEQVTIEIKRHSSCEGKLCFFNLKKCFGWLSNSG